MLVLSINLKLDTILVCKCALEKETGFEDYHFMSVKGNDVGAQRLGILPSKEKPGKASGESNVGVKVKC